jgi:uncharacterized protein YjiS (DUF1127 family)
MFIEEIDLRTVKGSTASIRFSVSRLLAQILSLFPRAHLRLPIDDLSDRDLADLGLNRWQAEPADPRKVSLF